MYFTQLCIYEGTKTEDDFIAVRRDAQKSKVTSVKSWLRISWRNDFQRRGLECNQVFVE